LIYHTPMFGHSLPGQLKEGAYHTQEKAKKSPIAQVLDRQYLVNLPTRSCATLTLNLLKHVRKGWVQG
jgi:hypothetical protein